MSGPKRGGLAALGALALMAGGVALASPAAAADPVTACHWIDREYLDTYTCEKPVASVDMLRIVECWKFPPSPRTHVRQKTSDSDGWVTNPAITVKTSGTWGCKGDYPYRTVVTIPGTLLAEMEVTRVRLTMPASEGSLPDGTAYSFGKTSVTYGACIMPEGSLNWCPER